MPSEYLFSRRRYSSAPQSHELDPTQPVRGREVHTMEWVVMLLGHARSQLPRRKRRNKTFKSFLHFVHGRPLGGIGLRHIVDERTKELKAQALRAQHAPCHGTMPLCEGKDISAVYTQRRGKGLTSRKS